MQHLFHTLRELKRIAPRSEYASWSRAEILGTSQSAGYRISVASLLRGAGAFAMAGLAVVGGASLVSSVLGPSQAGDAPLNQQALSAEAETVAVQLALADVQYQALAEDADKGSMNPTALAVAKSAAGSSSNTEVDRALLALSD